jgi:hypothetical protein
VVRYSDDYIEFLAWITSVLDELETLVCVIYGNTDLDSKLKMVYTTLIYTGVA